MSRDDSISLRKSVRRNVGLAVFPCEDLSSESGRKHFRLTTRVGYQTVTMSQQDDKSSVSSDVLQKQMNDLQQLVALQMQVMEMHTKSIADPSLRSTPTISSQQVKNIKAPEGRMSTAEFRMYSKDCRDFMKLTQFTNEQIVIQMRLNMDADLKRVVDTNFGDSWNEKSVEDALISIKEIIKNTRNSAVHKKMFDGMSQKSSESVREFITRLKACKIDCEYMPIR